MISRLAEIASAHQACAVPMKSTRRSDLIEVTVYTLSGRILAVLSCCRDCTILDLKTRLSRVTGALICHQQLVSGKKLLDSDSIAACETLTPVVTLQYVQTEPSSVAQILQERASWDNPAQAVESSLVDVIDSMMQREHNLSEEGRLLRAIEVERAMPFDRRAELIAWMTQALDACNIDSCILHGAVATLDRYYAVQGAQLSNHVLHRTVLGAVCTELKLVDNRPTYWKSLIKHLCQGRERLSKVLETEYHILSKLNFVCGLPVPLTFLRGLGLRYVTCKTAALPHSNAEPQPDTSVPLALFFLELALLDPHLLYDQPHVILAGAAMSAAYRATSAPQESLRELFDDLLTYAPALVDTVKEELVECEGRLLRLWVDSFQTNHEFIESYEYLTAKYASALRGVSATRVLTSWQNDDNHRPRE